MRLAFALLAGWIGAVGCARAPLVVRAGGSAVEVAATAPVVARAVDERSALGEFDRGELTLSLHGKPYGHESFIIDRTAEGFRLRTEVRIEVGSTLRLLDGELRTDQAWRPTGGVFRDVRDGVTITTLDGDPPTLRTTPRLAPATVRTASRAVELFLADQTVSHFAPLCAITAPTTRIGFPGMDVVVGADEPRPGGLHRRRVDLGGTMRALLLCDDEHLVAVEVPMLGLLAVRDGRRSQVEAASIARTRSRLSAALVEQPRTVRVLGGPRGAAAAPACSLVTPPSAARAARWPAVILLSGSGPQDRDGDAPGPGGVKLGLLRTLADALATAGVASLRCDDRGTGDSTGRYGAATVDTFVADAAAMLTALRREPYIVGDRLSVIGHSEGAVVALRLAAVDHRLARLVLLAGPGRPIDVVLLEQVERTLGRAGLTADEIAASLGHHRAAFAAIVAQQPLPDTAEAREWAGGEAWLRSHLARELVEVAASVGAVDVLIAQGEVDQQVSVLDAEALARALAAAPTARVISRRYPQLNHNFVASLTGDVSEYVDPDGRVDPQLMADVAAFVLGDLR